MAVGDIVRRNAKRYPNKEAVVFKDVRLTWSELNSRVNRLAHALMERGAGKGDKVGVLSYNSNQYLEIMFATAKIGALCVPMNYRLTVTDHMHIIKDSGLNVLFVGEEFVDRANELNKETGKVKVIGIGTDMANYMESYEEMIEGHRTSEPNIVVDDGDLFNLIYTSGTTGLPKGVVRDHRSLEVNTNHVMLIAGDANFNDNHLVSFPLTSAGPYGLVVAYSYLGCTQTIVERVDIPVMLEAVEKEKTTVTVLAPTMISMLLNHPDFVKYDLSSMRLVYYGAAPMPLKLLKETMGKFPRCKFASLYGSTESYWGCSLIPEDHIDVEGNEKKEARLASVGREIGTTEVLIVDSEAKEVPRGEIGEILFKGKMVMREYVNLPELNNKTFKSGGILTGDIGRMAEDGYLYLLDRKQDMIISGGYNIYPFAVENVIYNHPAVLEAVVIGLPDDKWGEAVKAVVVLKDGMTASEKDIIAFCGTEMPGYMKPKSVDFSEEPLPKNPAGKILRRQVKEKYSRRN